MADIIVIGAGIAGASVAARLAETHKVQVLEMEERPGYHSTGRSAATYEPNYGPPSIRALTRAGRSFFETPPEGFAAAPLVSRRPTISVVPEHQQSQAAALMKSGADLQEISVAEAQRHFPALKAGYAVHAVLDPTTADIDVDLLHQGFLRRIKALGGDQAPAAQANGGSPTSAVSAGASGDILKIGEEQWQLQECYNCHKLKGEGGKKRGPELDNIGSLLSVDDIKLKIIDPKSWMAEGFEKEFEKGKMPDKYKDLMEEKDIVALATWLGTFKNTSVNTPKPIKKKG